MYPGRLDITRRVLNVLLVPYPYTIKGEAISAHETAAAAGRSMRDGSGADMHERDGRACWFNVALQDPPALPSGTACMEEWILGLVEAAKAETKQLHGVVLPEGALSLATAQRVADRLIGTGIDFFISGIGDSTEHDKPRNNRIYGRMYWTDDDQQSHSRTWLQGKHHRWRLESNQICQYHLGHALHPSNVWWEHIELGARKVELQGGVGGGALTALICEDLARIDPVQTVLRSTGPNLVFALLMDGPQLPQRWSARYATVLADDPGSSVITLTSLGMVKRSFAPGDNERLCVGLWKDSSGTTRELLLPQEHHALLLSLTRHRVEQFTLDGRSDGKSTAQLSLGGVHALKWQKPKPSEQPASAEAPRTQAPPAHRSPQSSRGAASPGWTYEKYARAAHGIAYRVAYPNNAKVCEAGSGVGLTRECVDDAREHAPITSGE
jgi:hypothetical protein